MPGISDLIGGGITGGLGPAAGAGLSSLQSSSSAKSGTGTVNSSSYGSFGDFTVSTGQGRVGAGGVPMWMIAAGIGAVVVVLILLRKRG